MHFKLSVIAICLLSLSSGLMRAGDAVAVAYNAEGIWTAATYFCSSTPKGGSDYRDASGAREAVQRDLKKRAGENVARTSVIASSDRTGHFAYARGKTTGGKEMHAVGFGVSEAEAAKDALERLNRDGATVDQKVIYKYFSYGADARVPR